MVESNFSIKGDELMKEAEKKLKGKALAAFSSIMRNLKGGFFSNLTTTKAERIEAASDLYKEAAKNYKLAKRCTTKLSPQF